jgi:hypothetical protein
MFVLQNVETVFDLPLRRNSPGHKCNLTNNTRGGGGVNWPWILGTLVYKGLKFERGENLTHKTQVFRFIFVFFICHYSTQ